MLSYTRFSVRKKDIPGTWRIYFLPSPPKKNSSIAKKNALVSFPLIAGRILFVPSPLLSPSAEGLVVIHVISISIPRGGRNRQTTRITHEGRKEEGARDAVFFFLLRRVAACFLACPGGRSVGRSVGLSFSDGKRRDPKRDTSLTDRIRLGHFRRRRPPLRRLLLLLGFRARAGRRRSFPARAVRPWGGGCGIRRGRGSRSRSRGSR
mmetsp:Transcript_27356/g.88357  ORF Transcript_27356/g.88357 Transcript_27356/m.88357 type:complete len:207 (-) Transcript_27356:1100-1720(-)